MVQEGFDRNFKAKNRTVDLGNTIFACLRYVKKRHGKERQEYQFCSQKLTGTNKLHQNYSN